MASFNYMKIFLVLLVGAQADSNDLVQVELKSRLNVKNDSNNGTALTFRLNDSRMTGRKSSNIHRAEECVVTLSEHWDASIKPAYTGHVKTLTGVGTFPLGDFRTTSSVKVAGEGCSAYGYTSGDCGGADGTPISWNTQIDGLQPGLVGPSTVLAAKWGCNDCILCVQVKKKICKCPGGTPAIGVDCPSDGSTTCSACDASHYLSDSQCSACKTCAAASGAEIKTECTQNADAVCQCSRGYAGSLGDSCTLCTGTEYQDDVDGSACKGCANGAETHKNASEGDGNVACKDTQCQRPKPSSNSHVDISKCPEQGGHGVTCSLLCNSEYWSSSPVDFTCKAVGGEVKSAYTGGSIVCTKITPAPTAAPTTAAPTAAPTQAPTQKPWVFGSLGSVNGCPSGYVGIFDETKCIEIASDLGWKWMPKGAGEHDYPGCMFASSSKSIYFNKWENPKGTWAPTAAGQVCKVVED